jgi:hypothetical protein
VKKNIKILIVIALVIVIAATGFYSLIYLFMSPPNMAGPPSTACIEKCKSELQSGTDLSNGPCLSNNIATGWVCDVAHSPRTVVDDNPANQCSEYGKSASHFVEVDPDCSFIRAV